MLESPIQSKIIAYAKKNGWFVVKTIRLNISGMPDIFMFKNGVTFFVEVKSATGIHKPLQKLRQKQLRDQGFYCEVVRSLEDFKIKLGLVK